MLKHILRVLAIVLLLVIGVVVYLAWPDQARLDIAAVQGARPTISAPRRQVLPTIEVADVVGWQGGAMPTPAAGLAVAPVPGGAGEKWAARRRGRARQR